MFYLKFRKSHSFRSKTLPETQLCTKDRKLLAVVKFEHYLYGRKFLLRTDHPSLTWLRNFKEPNVMIARWISVLDTYDFNIQHRKGSFI